MQAVVLGLGPAHPTHIFCHTCQTCHMSHIPSQAFILPAAIFLRVSGGQRGFGGASVDMISGGLLLPS